MLGPHVKKLHAPFWSALFTVDTLQTSIDNKQLVACTVAEGDHDQKFLICLACDSIRTTDRNHFQKNGKIHEDAHYEKCTQMIATRKGTQYIPKSQTDMEKLLTQLDKFKRKAKMCEHDHQDMAEIIADKEDAEQEVAMLKMQINDLSDTITRLKEKDFKNRKIAVHCTTAISRMHDDLPEYSTSSVAIRVNSAISLIKQFLASLSE